jgi:hypothetical protein
MKTFEQFRAELADAVTVAINTDVWIGGGYDEGCRCPLGVRTPSWPRPGSSTAATAWGVRNVDALAFIDGFDGNPPDSPVSGAPFYALGCLYRARFVEGKR